MSDTYTLYGSYASYYTAKTRSYLRKKGIPFVERLPSDPMFRNKVRPSSGSHRIPQLLTPAGTVIQDSVEILDHLETKFPELPAFPATPKLRTFVHLMELLASEGLVQLAWLHRWLFAENRDFVLMDFGRSFRPQGSDAELREYGQLIADRMMSYGLPESTPELRDKLDAEYLALLRLFEAHLIEHPYLLGGHPSAADYALMGALHAHMGRDPAGLRMMQQHAPRTFRWMEHMLVPEVQSPEFYQVPVAYPADDEVPATARAFMLHIAEKYGRGFVLSCLAFNQYVADQQPQPGQPLDAERDQPTLPPVQLSHGGASVEHAANLHHVWLAQRAQRYLQSLTAQQQAAVLAMVGPGMAQELLAVPVAAVLVREDNRLLIGA